MLLVYHFVGVCCHFSASSSSCNTNILIPQRIRSLLPKRKQRPRSHQTWKGEERKKKKKPSKTFPNCRWLMHWVWRIITRGSDGFLIRTKGGKREGERSGRAGDKYHNMCICYIPWLRAMNEFADKIKQQCIGGFCILGSYAWEITKPLHYWYNTSCKTTFYLMLSWWELLLPFLARISDLVRSSGQLLGSGTWSNFTPNPNGRLIILIGCKTQFLQMW